MNSRAGNWRTKVPSDEGLERCGVSKVADVYRLEVALGDRQDSPESKGGIGADVQHGIVALLELLGSCPTKAGKPLARTTGLAEHDLILVLQHAATIRRRLKSGRLQDRALEQGVLRAAVGSQMVENGTSASRLAHSSDLVLVAVEEADEVLDPLQGGALVVQTCVRVAVGFDTRAGQETVGAHTVVGSDVDEAVVARVEEGHAASAVIWSGVFATEDVGAAIEPGED